jgi:sugar lactone lactonase YvrE
MRKPLMLGCAALAVGAVSIAPVANAGKKKSYPPPKKPDCTNAVANPDTLWPPNHKFRSVSIEGVSGNITVLAVTQDEPLNSTGDGNFEPDARLTGGDSVDIRAERSGNGDGRVYRIKFKAKNKYGYCNGYVTVSVPHSQGNPNSKKGGRIARDSGQNYNSLG